MDLSALRVGPRSIPLGLAGRCGYEARHASGLHPMSAVVTSEDDLKRQAAARAVASIERQFDHGSTMADRCSFCGSTAGPFSKVEGLFTVLMCADCQAARGHGSGPYPVMTRAQMRATLDCSRPGRWSRRRPPSLD